MKYKIGIGGIHIESSTFTPYISSKEDFIITRGKELLDRYSWLSKYREEVEFVPLIHARALPGGIVDENFYNEWKNEFLNKIKDQKLDGILFDIHGAMSVENIVDAEGSLIEEMRNLVGNSVKISSTMDLHGNVSDKLFDNTDLITCYRTAPHVDTSETRERAFKNLIFSIKHKNEKIYKCKVYIPILLPGEKTSTETEPGKSMYKMLDEVCCDEGIIDASIWMGFPWADEERCHGVVVVVGFNSDVVKKNALKIGQRFIDNRRLFDFVGPTDTLENSIQKALDSDKKPFFISDTGDNPGAGGVGDMNLILKSFYEVNKKNNISKKILIASIFDKESIEKIYSIEDRYINLYSDGDCYKSKKINLNLGGKFDLSFGGPINIDCNIEYRFYDNLAGRSALVKHDNIYIIVTENRFQYGKLSSFEIAGIKSFDEFDIIVVKMGYLEPDLSKLAKGWTMALTPGAVNQDLLSVEYKYLSSPLYPFDNIDDYKISSYML